MTKVKEGKVKKLYCRCGFPHDPKNPHKHGQEPERVILGEGYPIFNGEAIEFADGSKLKNLNRILRKKILLIAEIVED